MDTTPRNRTIGRAARPLLAAVALGAALLTASPAQAETTGDGSGEAASVGARAERACLRIPNLTIRTDNVLDRINGDAETPGSLLWLDTRIERARDNGRDQMVEVLENRRAVREASIPVFELRQGELDTLRQRCLDAGVEL